MEVVSIADYDRARASEGDIILDSAVDQLEALVQPTAKGQDVAKMMYRFGDLTLDDGAPPLRFQFDPPTICKQWPGPKYGDLPLHKPRLRWSLRKHHQSDDLKHDPRPRKSSKPKKSAKAKKVESAPLLPGSVASRNPPLSLLSLPPEVRNLIWSLLAVHSHPVEAQLRPIRACKKLSSPLKGKVVRRSPCEPRVAAVNRQLRREVLSIFYGSNHFVFEKNACSMFKEYGMLSPLMMRKWRPRSDVASFLVNVDVRFNALPRAAGMLSVVYKLKRLPDGNITVLVIAEKTGSKKKIEATGYCLCAEKAVAETVAKLDCGGDVTTMAAAVVVKRLESLFSGPTISKGNAMYPAKEKCDNCESPTFEIVYSGI